MAVAGAISCRKCRTLSDWGERVPFSAECSACHTELHSCLHCQSYAPGRHNDCNDGGAEPVVDKDRRNRCEWFRPVAASSRGAVPDPAASARAAAEALFKKK